MQPFKMKLNGFHQKVPRVSKEIITLYAALLTNIQKTSKSSPVIDRLHFTRKKVNCKQQTRKTGHKASSHLICKQSAFTMSAMLPSAMSITGVCLFSAKYSCQKLHYTTRQSRPVRRFVYVFVMTLSCKSK